jgi:hypothetical protein
MSPDRAYELFAALIAAGYRRVHLAGDETCCTVTLDFDGLMLANVTALAEIAARSDTDVVIAGTGHVRFVPYHDGEPTV